MWGWETRFWASSPYREGKDQGSAGASPYRSDVEKESALPRLLRSGN
ncbi:MAG: hypothetical protein JWM16_6461 [Verrucomicrobiales bacterium]|nr:hypothetical protein [Verrucomicrobiales bacterium]